MARQPAKTIESVAIGTYGIAMRIPIPPAESWAIVHFGTVAAATAGYYRPPSIGTAFRSDLAG
jgi:hypothetical protein